MFKTIFETVIEALFPISQIERDVLAIVPEDAHNVLPKSPSTPLADTSALFAYKDERVSKLIWLIKYKKSKKAVSIGGFAMFEYLKNRYENDRPLIISMPITSRRRKERGYNQCELIADEMQRLDITKKFDYAKNILLRSHHTSRQTLKNREERLEGAKGIFNVDVDTLSTMYSRDSDILNRNIIVIDDVITTGSTMKEAMETLRSVGFKNVRGVSLAH